MPNFHTVHCPSSMSTGSHVVPCREWDPFCPVWDSVRTAEWLSSVYIYLHHSLCPRTLHRSLCKDTCGDAICQSTFPQRLWEQRKFRRHSVVFPGVHDLCWQRLPTTEHSSLQMHEAVCFQAALPQQQLDKSSPRFSRATTVAKAKTELKDLIHRARKPK